MSLHFSDTIQQSSHTEYHDTTVSRLWLWYKVLRQKLWFKEQSPIFIGSEFWNSFQTAAQAIAYLQNKDQLNTEVILVNNASRAKHTNSWNAKGSDCLWIQIEIDGITHHVVWVDDDAFAFLLDFQKLGTKLKKIRSIHYENFQILDLSQGTQFRSKDHFPLVQLLLEKILHENGEITEESLRKMMNFEDYEVSLSQDGVRQKIWDILWEWNKTPQSYVDNIKWKLPEIIWSGGINSAYIKAYVSGLWKGVENIQLIGELYTINEKFGIDISQTRENLSTQFAREIGVYEEAQRKLQVNQLLLIDRDKFWNAIFATHPDVSGILWLPFVLDSKVEVVCNGEWFEAYITQTISDKTGEVCIWKSSSRGPNGEVFLNINRSIWTDGKILEATQNIPIGSVFTLKEIISPS